jgi:hypothetical protein
MEILLQDLLSRAVYRRVWTSESLVALLVGIRRSHRSGCVTRERASASRLVHSSGLEIQASPFEAKSPRRAGCLFCLAWMALCHLGMGELTPTFARATEAAGGYAVPFLAATGVTFVGFAVLALFVARR